MRIILSILTIHSVLRGSLGAFNTADATNIHAAVLGTSYNNYVRPSDVTNVSIEFVLFSLNDLDIKNQVMSTSGWMTVTWEDPRLTWTAATYGGIQFIYTKQNKIWKPELIIDNSVAGMDPIGHDEIFFKVKNTGEVRWDPPGIYVTHCDIDVTYYPFDYQMCQIEVTSFAFTTNELNLVKIRDTVNTVDYRENGEWILHTSRVESKSLEENGEFFSQLDFKIVFKRRPGYYLTNIVYPVILISLLTNLAFLLPADSGEKISYILTVLLAIAVLLTIVGGSMPTTSKHNPAIGAYISIILLMAAMGIVITVLNLRLYLRTDQSNTPKWLQCLTFTFLLKLNCKSKKVQERSEDQLVDDLELHNMSNGNKTLKRMMNRCSQSESIVQKEERDFPFDCKEVSVFLDFFFFYLFNAITFITTMIFFIVIAVCDVPPI